MPEATDGDDDDGSAQENGIIKTQITPDPDTAEYELLEYIAEMEGVEIEALPSFYDEIDHFVERLFQQPPSAAAQVEITFSYAGYRIRLDWKGNVTLVDVKRSLHVDENAEQ